jgi:uncharacterized protein
MKITVRVSVGVSKPGIEKKTESSYLVRVSARAKEGEANKAVVVVLAKYFKISASLVRIVSGKTSRNKTVEIIS